MPNVIPFPVVPITDYEPPAFGGAPVLPPVVVTRRRPTCPAPRSADEYKTGTCGGVH